MADQEQYGQAGYNSEALRRAAGIIGQETSKNVNRMTKDEDNPEGALMTTYVQLMDSYSEGTIDAHIEDSLNGVGDISRPESER